MLFQATGVSRIETAALLQPAPACKDGVGSSDEAQVGLWTEDAASPNS